MIVRRYTDLLRYNTFDDRFAYLKLNGNVGRATFGFDRYINQDFYASREWKSIRNHVITRDNGCDLGIPGFEIHSDILIHHMNPLDISDIVHSEEWILDPEYLITTTKKTHNAIHYGSDLVLPKVVPERQPGDTALW